MSDKRTPVIVRSESRTPQKIESRNYIMNDGRSFESYVQFVFSSLLNMKDEGVVVGRNVQLVDKFGLTHRVDIFYQFERAGITHKVAIECKNHGRPVENGEVAEFYGKLCNAGALRLAMVARNGYQLKRLLERALCCLSK